MARGDLQWLERMSSLPFAWPRRRRTRSRMGAPLEIGRRQHWRDQCRGLINVDEAVVCSCVVYASCWCACGAKASLVGGRLRRLARRFKLGQLTMWSFLTVLGLRVGALLRLFGFCNRHRQASQFTSACHAHSPSESSLVTRAVLSQVQALCAVWSTSIAFGLAVLAGEAVIRRPCCRRSSAALPR